MSTPTPRNSPAGAPPPSPASAAASAPSKSRRRMVLAVLERFLLTVAIGGSFALIYWNMGRLRTVRTEARALEQQAVRLQGEITMMKARWSDDAISNTVNRHQTATNHLLGDATAVEAWQQNLHTQAVPLVLSVEVNFVGSRQEKTGNGAATVMETELEVAPGPVPGAQSMYRRLVPFLNALQQQSGRSDITALQVEGGSNSIMRASASVDLWTVDQTATP